MDWLKKVDSAGDWNALHTIRRAVLFTPDRHDFEFEYDENHPNDRDPNNQPFLLIHGDEAIGAVRLDKRGKVGVVRLVAIAEHKQGQGHGRTLSNLLDAEARRIGITTLYINAAPDAVGYYEKSGWQRLVWDPSELTGFAAGCVQMTKSLS